MQSYKTFPALSDENVHYHLFGNSFLGLRVIDSLDRQVELVLVMFSCAIILDSPVSEHSHQRDPILVIKREYPIIEHISNNKSYLSIVKFNCGYLCVCINKCLLINMFNTFDFAHIISILGSRITRMVCLDFTSKHFFLISLLQSYNLNFSEYNSCLDNLCFLSFESLAECFRSFLNHMIRTPYG